MAPRTLGGGLEGQWKYPLPWEFYNTVDLVTVLLAEQLWGSRVPYSTV